MSTLSAWCGGPYRGDGGQAEVTFSLAALSLTDAWGAQAGTARCQYVANSDVNAALEGVGVATGAAVRIDCPGRSFHGICMQDTLQQSSSGRTRELVFHDLREFLKWDLVFGAFNLPKHTLVDVGGGEVRRVRRYRHLLPANFNSHIETWTAAPYSAGAILTLILGAPTVSAPWIWEDITNESALVNIPVLGIDCQQGRSLDQVLSEIADRMGLVFTFTGINGSSNWVLRWARKGVGTFPLPLTQGGLVDWDQVPNANQCTDGFRVAEHPSLVRVLGGRNRWQLANVTLTPDWAAGWNNFLDPAEFVEYVFQNFRDPNGVIFANRSDSGDPDQMIARQLAAARAYTVTVREMAAVAGVTFMDWRKLGGRWRAEMPALLYLKTVAFRAFRLPDTVSLGGTVVNTRACVRMIEGMLVEVTHDPVTGFIDPSVGAPSGDGTGYAVAQGYQLEPEFFEQLSPSRFDATEFVNSQSLWTKVDFKVDDGGDGMQTLLFDRPLVQSANLYTSIDGHGVFNASFTLQIPAVRAAVTIEADRGFLDVGTAGAGIEVVINEPDLVEERYYDVTGSSGAAVVLPYADGFTAGEKAATIANVALLRPTVVRQGGFTRPLVAGVNVSTLDGLIDRVEVSYSSQGYLETIHFTGERGRWAFEPERDYERRRRGQGLFSGQAELQAEARRHYEAAVALKQTPMMLAAYYQAFAGFGRPQNLAAIPVASGSGTLNGGTPLWRSGSELSGGRLTNTTARMPNAVGEDDLVFAGITLQHNASATRPVLVSTAGPVLARVKGPVAVNDAVGRAAVSEGQTVDYLDASGEPAIGQARQAIADTSIQLIEITLGAGGGGGATPIVWQ